MHLPTCAGAHFWCPTSPNVFFFNDTATTEIYTLPLHDALPIWKAMGATSISPFSRRRRNCSTPMMSVSASDRKSTLLNSSHPSISYAVFCLKNEKHKLKSGSVRAVHGTLYRHCAHQQAT